jgi:ATP-dependent DNA helicase PIF1
MMQFLNGTSKKRKSTTPSSTSSKRSKLSITGFSSSPIQASQKKAISIKVPEDPDLCPEQQDLVNIILSGRNVFYTGSAGCGKSTVLRAFVKALRAQEKNVRIVAPTGRAAVDIGGTTLHAFAGLTPDALKFPIDKLRQKAFGKALYKRFRETEVLVIDEISMVENHFLERVSEMLKAARTSDAPFGGVQLVVLGDFYQLPPVKPFQYCLQCGRENKRLNNIEHKCSLHGIFRDEDKWAFRAKCWKEAKFHCVNLNSIHRQKDQKFIALLEKCRQGRPFSSEERKLLLDHKCEVSSAVQLYATREEVRRINEIEFAKLKSEKLVYRAVDGIKIEPHHEFELKFKAARDPDGSLSCLREHRLEKLLEMKSGMQVILLTNLDIEQGLINGSQGVIIGWDEITEGALPIAHNPDSKSQHPTRPLIFGEHNHIKEGSIKEFVRKVPIKKWPKVRFDNGVTVTIMAECQVSELGDAAPHSLIARTQIPILPAWAMSIHKSQGMTLSKVIVDLSRNFENGQVYVALSRAKSLFGLKVMGLGAQQGGPCLEVKDFLEETFGRQVTEIK